MKKILPLILVAIMMCLTTTVFAVDSQRGTTTLTATVPPAEYTIQIPADSELKFGIDTPQKIGEVSVTNCTHFRDGERILCVAVFTDLIEVTNSNCVIPVKYTYDDSIAQWYNHALVSDYTVLPMYEKSDNEIRSYLLYATVGTSDWENAGYGQYEATMTFKFWVPTNAS